MIRFLEDFVWCVSGAWVAVGLAWVWMSMVFRTDTKQEK